jgi:hypothetical protein
MSSLGNARRCYPGSNHNGCGSIVVADAKDTTGRAWRSASSDTRQALRHDGPVRIVVADAECITVAAK